MEKEKSLSETFLRDTFWDTMYLILYAAAHQPYPRTDLESAFFEVAVYNFLEGLEIILCNSRPEDASFVSDAHSLLEQELEEGNHLDSKCFEDNLYTQIVDKDINPLCYAFFKQSVDRIKILREMEE